jgi:hypothetical protein
MVAHYAIEARFCRPGEGHDKGGVESRGGHVRWQHLVPVPRGQTLEEISAALQIRVDAQHARDPARTAAWEDERRALRAVPEPFDGRQVRAVQLRHHASHAVAGGHYSVPSRWCGHTVDLFVGTDTVSFARGDEVVCHPRVPFGGRSVDYRHLLLPLSRKPQALRQVVHELVAQFGPPWPALWEALRACYAPDELEAARRLAPWLERADRQGLARIAPRIRAAIADGTLVSPPQHSVGAEDLAEVPAALRLYAIEAPDLGRYDALLEAARCSA